MISVIVTFYNSEKYLKECLDSIVFQTFQDYEVIMVDDGSADSSRAIALNYTSDARFKLINSEHVGFPEAKNIGLANTTGDYIIFLDSDDIAEPFWLEFLVKALEENKADIVYCGFNKFHNEEDLLHPLLSFSDIQIKDMTSQKMCPLFYDGCLSYMWNKLIKKDLYKDIYFEDCIALSDSQVMYKIFDKASRVFQVGANLVNYRKHDESMSATTRGTVSYWEYRLDLMLQVVTFVFDKYDISKFICKRFLNEELYKLRSHVGKKDYDNIYKNNEDRIKHILVENYDCDFDIDLVVPFVDNREKVWQQSYIDLTHNEGFRNNARFDNPDMFEYFLRGVDKFMPWIRKIHLIVSNIEQVPDYINKEKTHIVLHKDIIPEEYLPTFNSSTIEMFIPNIEGLSEHFIYGNDDMYPIDDLKKSDFFSKDGRPKIVYKINYVQKDITFFNRLCLNVYRHTAAALHTLVDDKTFLRPEHTLAPFILSHCKDCVDKMWHFIKEDLGPFRTDKQHTQYMYALYEKFTNNYEFGGPSFRYHALNGEHDNIINEIKYRAGKILCLNGVSEENTEKDKLDEIKRLLADNLK